MRRLRQVNRNSVTEWDAIYADPEVATRWTQWFDGSLVDAFIGEIPRGATVLDVACGVGLAQYAIQKLRNRPDVKWFGLDSSLRAVEYLRRHSSVTWDGIMCWDVRTALPFRDNAFDLVMACEILEHLEDPDALVGEIARVAKDKFLVTVPNGMHVDTEYHVWELTKDDIERLLLPYGTVRVKLARNDDQIVGVCQKCR